MWGQRHAGVWIICLYRLYHVSGEERKEGGVGRGKAGWEARQIQIIAR